MNRWLVQGGNVESNCVVEYTAQQPQRKKRKRLQVSLLSVKHTVCDMGLPTGISHGSGPETPTFDGADSADYPGEQRCCVTYASSPSAGAMN